MATAASHLSCRRLPWQNDAATGFFIRDKMKNFNRIKDALKRIVYHRLAYPVFFWSILIVMVCQGNTAPESIRSVLDKYDGHIPVLIAWSKWSSSGGFTSTSRAYILIPDSARSPVIITAAMNNREPEAEFNAYSPPFKNPEDIFRYYVSLIPFTAAALFSFVEIARWLYSRKRRNVDE